MTTKRSVSVAIAGQRFVLRSDVDEATAQQLAGQVDRRIREIHRGVRGTVDSQQVAVLAALQLAEELHNERRAIAELKRQVRERSRALLRMLERAVGG